MFALSSYLRRPWKNDGFWQNSLEEKINTFQIQILLKALLFTDQWFGQALTSIFPLQENRQ